MEFFDTPVGSWPAIDLGQLAQRRGTPDVSPIADAFLAHGAAVERLEELTSGKALCVTTGQQPGLLLGPLYTVYKALSAAATAARFQAILQRPVVPVFWVAGDDHDFAEANHVTLVDNAGEPVHLELRRRAGSAPSTPMYRETLGDDIHGVLAAAREALPPTEFLEAAMRDVTGAYRPDVDLATAFAESLSRVVGAYGVVVLNPTAPAFKLAQAPLLVRALEGAVAMDRELAAAAAALESAGSRVPVKVGDGASLVMIEGELGRDRLITTEGGFTTRRSGEGFSLAQLRQIAAHDAVRLSANVLLRPVVEAALLPTLAYVGGPGELAYFAQCDPVYRALGVIPQARVPRWSATLVEPRVQKTLHKYGVTVNDFAGPAGELETRLAGEDLPPEISEILSRVRDTVTEAYQRLGTAAQGIDPTLKRPVESARNQSLAAARDIEKKILSHLKQRNEILLRQIGRARGELFPAGVRQERALNLLPFLARYGDEFLRLAYEACCSYVDFETMGFRAV